MANGAIQKRREISNVPQLIGHALVRVQLIKKGLRILRRRMARRELNELQSVMALLEMEARAESLEGHLLGRDTSRHRLHRWSFDDAYDAPDSQGRRVQVPAPGLAAGRAGRSRKGWNMVYLASPYSHPSEGIRQARFERACEAAAQLMRSTKFGGVSAPGAHDVVFSPVAHSHPMTAYGLPACDQRFWARLDRAILEICTSVAVLMLTGWQSSRGIRAELNIARKLGLPISYHVPATLGVADVPLENARPRGREAAGAGKTK